MTLALMIMASAYFQPAQVWRPVPWMVCTRMASGRVYCRNIRRRDI